MELKHGLNAYKRRLCKCPKCTTANRQHERRQRVRVRKHERPQMPFLHDTLTLEEFKKFRAEA